MGKRTSHRRVVGIAAAALFGSVLGASGADARNELLRWTHPNPSQVQRFTVHWGNASRSYQQSRDVGIPPANGQGVYSVQIPVPDSSVVYVSVSAVGKNNLRSGKSNEQVRRPAAPPAPTPTPPPGGTPPGGFEPDPRLGAPGQPQVVVP